MANRTRESDLVPGQWIHGLWCDMVANENLTRQILSWEFKLGKMGSIQYVIKYLECVSLSVMSDSLWPQGLKPARLLCPWDSPGKDPGVDCHSLFQGIFPTQRLNQGLQHCIEKVGLKLNIQKTKIMASGPITSWQIVGETMETVTDFIFGGSQITADGECNHEIKRRLFLGRKAMTNLGSILKSWDITLPTKVHPVKALVFPVVIYGCESWTTKKAEC